MDPAGEHIILGSVMGSIGDIQLGYSGGRRFLQHVPPVHAM